MTGFTSKRAMSVDRQHGKSIYQQMLKRRPVEDLVIDTGTVYGSRYHTVKPVGGNWQDMQAWCLTTYGESGKHIWGANETPEPGQRWYMNNAKFWFREEKDLTMFILRWR